MPEMMDTLLNIGDLGDIPDKIVSQLDTDIQSRPLIQQLRLNTIAGLGLAPMSAGSLLHRR
jgi:hypothetical protein